MCLPNTISGRRTGVNAERCCVSCEPRAAAIERVSFLSVSSEEMFEPGSTAAPPRHEVRRKIARSLASALGTCQCERFTSLYSEGEVVRTANLSRRPVDVDSRYAR